MIGDSGAWHWADLFWRPEPAILNPANPAPPVARRLRRLRRLRLLTTGHHECRSTGQDDCRRPPSHTANRGPPRGCTCSASRMSLPGAGSRSARARSDPEVEHLPVNPRRFRGPFAIGSPIGEFRRCKARAASPHCRCASRDQLAALGGIEPPKSQDCKPWSRDLVTIAPATAGAHRSRRTCVAASSSTPSRRARACPWRHPRARARHRPEVMRTWQPPPRAALPRPVA